MLFVKPHILEALCILSGDNFVYEQQQQDEVFHYSAIKVMRNVVYTGEKTIGEIKTKGDFGFGIYNLFNAELISLYGMFHEVDSDGKIMRAITDRKIPFASVTFFKQDKDFEELQNAILTALPSSNHFYAIRIHLTCDTVVNGGASKVNWEETKGIAEFMTSRPLYKASQKTGTIIGFYFPRFIRGLEFSHIHFHFISDDKTYGGHLISGSFKATTKIEVQPDEKKNYKLYFYRHKIKATKKVEKIRSTKNLLRYVYNS